MKAKITIIIALLLLSLTKTLALTSNEYLTSILSGDNQQTSTSYTPVTDTALLPIVLETTYNYGNYSCTEYTDLNAFQILTKMQYMTIYETTPVMISNQSRILKLCNDQVTAIDADYASVINNTCYCPTNSYKVKTMLRNDQMIFEINYTYPSTVTLLNQLSGLNEDGKYMIDNYTFIRYSNSELKAYLYGDNYQELNESIKYHMGMVVCMLTDTDESCLYYAAPEVSKAISASETLATSNTINQALSAPFIIALAIILIFAAVKKKEKFIPLTLHLKMLTGLYLAVLFLIYFYALLSLFWPILVLFIALPISAMLRKNKTDIKLERNDAPRLYEMLDKLSSEMKIKAPQNVYLNPATSIGVSGVTKKSLNIGLAGITKLTEADMYAVLSHELAHLKGSDTVIGNFIMSIKIGLDKFVPLNRIRIPLNPIALIIYLIALAYNAIYTACILFYTRSREYIADLYAASITGSNNYANSFKKYVKYSDVFNKVIPAVTFKLMNEHKAIGNVYAFFETSTNNPKNKEFIDGIEKKSLAHEFSLLFSTHPTVESRIKNVIKAKLPDKKLSNSKAELMIKNLKEIQEKLTKTINFRLSIAKIRLHQ